MEIPILSLENSYSSDTLSSLLIGDHINLAPIKKDDVWQLGKKLISPTTWFSMVRDLTGPAQFQDCLQPIIERQARGLSLTLVARLNSTQEMVAMSTFSRGDADFKRLEIGFTWVADKWQKTFVNTEMKYLMLRLAFEDFKMARVEFFVHPRNTNSNQAMHRLGATFEGSLRKFRNRGGNDNGDRNVYSILDDEWPKTKSHLESLLKR